jgi:DNA-binding transcriptional regulator YhcF (GntR family)
MADWQSIKTEYITTDTSYRKLAQKYGVSYNAIGNRSRDEKWQELRDQHLTKTMTKSLNAIASQQASRAARLQTVADKLLTKVERLLEEDEELLADPSTMRDISRVLKDLKDIQMIKSDADMREQEARIDKLRKEAAGDEKAPKIEITLGGGLEDYAK